MLDELAGVIDKVCGADPNTLADGVSIQELHRCLARLDAATTRATAAFDSRGEWADDGARSSASWLYARCHLPQATARRRVRLGRALRHLPETEAAWVAGEIGDGQVSALAAARTPATRVLHGAGRKDAGGRGRPAALRLLRPGAGLLGPTRRSRRVRGRGRLGS